MPIDRPASVTVATLALVVSLQPAAAREARCVAMDVPVVRVDAAPSPYSDFCDTNADACDLTGNPIVEWSPRLHALLARINNEVNSEVTFIPDWENSGLEEIWSFPVDCTGDCEDYALEKRQRLVEAGLPSASLTIAIAFHEVQLFPHAVLLAETTSGTFVLDNLYDEILCWDAVPYFFTRRERPDGQWTRFQWP